MKLPIPREMLPDLGYAETDWVFILRTPSEKERKRLLSVANRVLDRIGGALVSPISRSIPVQQFKETLLKLPTLRVRLDEVVKT